MRLLEVTVRVYQVDRRKRTSGSVVHGSEKCSERFRRQLCANAKCLLWDVDLTVRV